MHYGYDERDVMEFCSVYVVDLLVYEVTQAFSMLELPCTG